MSHLVSLLIIYLQANLHYSFSLVACIYLLQISSHTVTPKVTYKSLIKLILAYIWWHNIIKLTQICVEDASIFFWNLSEISVSWRTRSSENSFQLTLIIENLGNFVLKLLSVQLVANIICVISPLGRLLFTYTNFVKLDLIYFRILKLKI